MYIVVGLGNPGASYALTRHNAGFMFVDALAEQQNAPQWTYVNKFKAQATSFHFGSEKILLFKPETYMNVSGVSISKILQYYKCPVANLVIVYDDIDIKLGKLRLRSKGKAGTHNGMRSVLSYLKYTGEDVPRLRLGIGELNEAVQKKDLSSYVLGKMNQQERKVLHTAITSGINALQVWWEKGFNIAMSQFNSR